MSSIIEVNTNSNIIEVSTDGKVIEVLTGGIIASGGGGGATNLAYTASPTNGIVTSDTGTDATIPSGSTTNASLMLPADKTKLDGVATGATANSTDAQLRDRTTHTGSQAISTVTGLQTALDAKQDTLVSGVNIKTINSQTLLGGGDIVIETATVVRKLVRNQTGSTIPKGTAVYQLGSSGIVMTVAPADASTEATASQTLGITQEAIADNTNGYVVAVGLLDGINTSALTEGQIVWLSETAGQLTTTRPTQPAHGVVMGYCVKQGGGASGILYVKVDNGLELAELHDVLLTGAVTGNVLAKASDGLWKPLTLTKSSVGLSNVDNTSDLDKPVSTAQRVSSIVNALIFG